MHVTGDGLSVKQEVLSHDVQREAGAPVRHGPVHLSVTPRSFLLLLLEDEIQKRSECGGYTKWYTKKNGSANI